MQDVSGGKRCLRAPRLVGREQERRLLDAALDRAIRFEAPQFVTVFGPLGIGKSRLVAEWLDSVERRGQFHIVETSAPTAATVRSDTPGIVEALLRRRFRIDDLDGEAACAAFRSELQSVFDDRRVSEIAGLLGHFLGFELPESLLGQALAVRPDQQIDVARAVLCRFLEADAQVRPLLVAIEDVHLADERSLDVLARLAAELGEASIVFVMTARPELLVRRPEWGRGEGSHARVEVEPLSPLQMDILIRSALGVETLAPGLAERAAVESGGNPFLLEQLLGLYREHGILVAETASSWSFDCDRAEREKQDLAPEQAAQARISTLSPAERDLLARAATFGMSFWTGGIVALGRLGSEPWDCKAVFAPDPVIEETRQLLASLADRDYVVPQPRSSIIGDTEWKFGHALEHLLLTTSVDVELMRRRKRFAAQWIEARTAGSQTAEQLEHVGILYEGGGDSRRAGQSFVAAADEARRCLQYDRARTLYLRGIRLLDLDDSILRIETSHKLGDVAARLGRTREALSHFSEMLRVAWRMDLPAKGGAAHARLGRLHRTLGDYQRASSHFELARLLFDLAGDQAGIAGTLDDLGRINLLTGHPAEAMNCHKLALGIRQQLDDRCGAALTFSGIGLVYAHTGDFLAAHQQFRRALAIAHKMRDPRATALSLLDLGVLERESGSPDTAQKLLAEGRRLARERAEHLCECRLALQIGECLRERGQYADAVNEIRTAKQIARRFGARRLVAEADRSLAELNLSTGDVISAANYAQAALEAAEAIGAVPLVGVALRVLAQAAVLGAPCDAERGGPREMFDRAVEILGNHGAELELARTLSAYAEFEQQVGRDEVARGLRADAEIIGARARFRARPEQSPQTSPGTSGECDITSEPVQPEPSQKTATA